ncbi:30S ribosomal protein S2 [Candidatus Berkiella cookevillensis]|uniref:Small ribosomal subunit protein uS2 n=1 Tax=Candidatus Berkiella cookevillensis TaxID=437022 RepID=A0A0Q9YT11_9GAMM|nr:30S ribosomal protein S2 [Candidatus Berkiella cookevillensis]MCS5708355.1 30S ribosomal protein S2 [Candidatus Berkiella cookevillensis]
MQNLNMKQLIEAGVHFGHQKRFWNPKMRPFIYGVRNRIHIINLDKTLPLYKTALDFISRTAARGGKVLFVGTKGNASEIVKMHAERCGMPYVNYRWLGGMLTNYKTVKQSIKRLKELEAMRDDGTLDKLVKKEALMKLRELEKLERGLGGIKNMGSLPDALFVLDVGNEKIAVKEANNLGIPVVGIVDTNNDPDGIDYVVPGNDDALRAIELYATTLADTILHAKQNSNKYSADDEFVELAGDDAQ